MTRRAAMPASESTLTAASTRLAGVGARPSSSRTASLGLGAAIARIRAATSVRSSAERERAACSSSWPASSLAPSSPAGSGRAVTRRGAGSGVASRLTMKRMWITWRPWAALVASTTWRLGPAVLAESP